MLQLKATRSDSITKLEHWKLKLSTENYFLAINEQIATSRKAPRKDELKLNTAN
ncbi:hypothetical protein [Maribacter spongiicola]|uniref:hypothetical protein n=1 Tax=Maribacter spongiicola TaxID=1206753 RepID=UPI001414E4CC|nr:hypothetical protein [Maribacter spongiicola]